MAPRFRGDRVVSLGFADRLSCARVDTLTASMQVSAGKEDRSGKEVQEMKRAPPM